MGKLQPDLGDQLGAQDALVAVLDAGHMGVLGQGDHEIAGTQGDVDALAIEVDHILGGVLRGDGKGIDGSVADALAAGNDEMDIGVFLMCFEGAVSDVLGHIGAAFDHDAVADGEIGLFGGGIGIVGEEGKSSFEAGTKTEVLAITLIRTFVVITTTQEELLIVVIFSTK